ncbi:hypothetical protein [Deinococcus sp. DB0503]|uniref:hypothetical protein n=1 Tax=Deinococcus sp. DB0503 TaxID=2479203 RepID=UPI0018DF56EB|nr:hypothetical protein [Deinococcus sp. DB0503]MBI0446871.1 hypothetical protein [Deinococcus sp. DB0503]
MLLHAAPASLIARLSPTVTRLNLRPLALAMAERDFTGTSGTVLDYVLSALQGALRPLRSHLEAVVDTAQDTKEEVLRVQFHYVPVQTFTAMHLGGARRAMGKLHRLLLPELLSRVAQASREVLPLFTPVEALGLYSQHHLHGAESDEEFADLITDLGMWDAALDLPREAALDLARRGGVRLPSEVERRVPGFKLWHPESVLPELMLPPRVQALADDLEALERQAEALPEYSGAECSVSSEALWPYYRESLLVDPFPTRDPQRLSFTREMHGELQDHDGDEYPIRTFVLQGNGDLERLDAYLTQVPALQESVRSWLKALHALGGK